MRRALQLTLALGALLALVPACPGEREELIDKVGGAPGRQVDHARARIEAAEKANLQRIQDGAKLLEE